MLIAQVLHRNCNIPFAVKRNRAHSTAVATMTSRAELISLFTGYPEHMAVVNDDIEALDAALAAADGDSNVGHHAGDTPLMLAIRLHRTRIVEHLIAVGANVDSGTTGWVAAQFGNERIMEVLLKAGLDPRLRFNFNVTLCHYAAMNSDAGVLRVLVAAGAPTDKVSDWHERPIHRAAENKNEEILSILLAAGCSPGPRSAMYSHQHDRSFPIHHAARNPNAAAVRLLIDAGVDVNALNGNGENPLFIACENANMELLDALLAAGAEWRNVRAKRTILHAVARNTNEAIVRRVIERGVDVNVRDSDGKTPLMTAAESCTAAVVTIFLEAGADVHAIDRDRKSVWQCACENKNVGIVRVLIAAGARFDVEVLKAAINQSNIDAVKALIDAGMNVADEIHANPSVLFDTRCKGEMLECLIRRGVDFRVVHDGQTLCHKANEGCLAVLFAHGADLNAEDSSGRTPIEVADAGEIATLAASGIDAAQRSWIWLHALENSFLAAVGHPQVSVNSVPRRQLAWACHRIAERQFDLLRLRAFQVCVGLQSFRLPALVSCEILAHTFVPLESLVAFHRVWAIVTTIKHFQRKNSN